MWETYTLIRVRARNDRELALGFLDDVQLCRHEAIGSRRSTGIRSRFQEQWKIRCGFLTAVADGSKVF